MAIPCITDTDCIHLDIDVSGILSATPIISADATNGVECRGSGLYAPGRPLFVSSLPAAPADGDEVYYLADDVDSIIWHLRYRSASASSYKWEYVGGGELAINVDTGESRSSASFGALTTAMEIALPANVTGDYAIRHGARINSSASGQSGTQAIKVGAAAATNNEGARNDSGQIGGADFEFPALGVAASAVLAAQYASSSGAATFSFRWMRVRPIRLSAV